MPDNKSDIPKPDFSQVRGSTPPGKPEPERAPERIGGDSRPTGPSLVRPVRSSAKPDFSNVQSGSSSTATVLEKTGTERLYTIQSGDSLSKIAKREYGDAKAWKQIFEANREVIQNPDLIHPGQVIKIPGKPTGGVA